MAHDPYKYFRIEVRDLLDQMGRSLLELERGAAPAETVSRLMRLAHTLKGAARVVNQGEIAELAHAIEDALSPLRGGDAPRPQAGIDSLLALLDAIGTHAAALDAPGGEARSVQVLAAGDLFHPVQVPAAEVGAVQEGISEALGQVVALRGGLADVERLRLVTEVLLDHLQSPRSLRAGDAAALALAEEARVLAGGVERRLATQVAHVERELREVNGAAGRLRLIPASQIFTALERTARDAARSLGRQLRFAAHGGEVRLEAEVLGGLQSALVQVVRNAVAHGIEPAGQRVAIGKPPEGRITLEVAMHGHQAAFVCSDDGGGIDVEAVRRAAGRQGLRDLAPSLGTDELLKLLLDGGISTSGTVTALSGRGVGLDVVREAVNRLGGQVTLQTAAQQGTTVAIRVPVSLAAMEALILGHGPHLAAIPLKAVRCAVRLQAADVTRTAGRQAIQWQGHVVPLAPLARIMRASGPWPDCGSAVVVEAQGTVVAVGVDCMPGVDNLVVMPLPAGTPADPLVAGAALDAAGHPQLVLDPTVLVAVVARLDAAAAPEAGPRLPILVIDDSLTTRMLEQSILESAGYDVELATSGEEGLSKARQRRYALFLVDVEMPGMDGFTFVAQTRADPTLGEVPAILVTSRQAPEDRQRGETVGASGYIVKSEFDQTALLDRIRQLVG
jgi:two-component system chemotaxis sensor kinase CheA